MQEDQYFNTNGNNHRIPHGVFKGMGGGGGGGGECIFLLTDDVINLIKEDKVDKMKTTRK